MKMTRITAAMATCILLAGMVLMTSCSSGSDSPTGPSGLGQGKALYRGQVVDSGGSPVSGADIYVNGAPALDGGSVQIVSGVDGYFEVTLQPGDAYTVEAWGEEPCVPELCDELIPDPTCVIELCDDLDSVLIWSYSLVVTPGNEIDPVEREVVSSGIGECVSECVHLYKPGSGVPPGDLITLGATKNGNFNATPCVQFCKENFRGGLPGDSSCNPFYLTYPVCNGEPADPGVPVDAVDAAGVDGPKPEKPEKPKKPKSNNGNGNGNS